MRIAIFYLSLTDSVDHESLALPNGGHVYIRIEEVEENSLLTALDKAQPRRGEVVMNTHRIDK